MKAFFFISYSLLSGRLSAFFSPEASVKCLYFYFHCIVDHIHVRSVYLYLLVHLFSEFKFWEIVRDREPGMLQSMGSGN